MPVKAREFYIGTRKLQGRRTRYSTTVSIPHAWLCNFPADMERVEIWMNTKTLSLIIKPTKKGGET